MLEALEAAGVEMIFDCRRGECGLCALPILAVDGIVDHRDVFFSEEEKASTPNMPLPAPTAESLPPNVAAKEQAGADHPHRQYTPIHHGLRRKAQQSTTERASGADATQNTAERQTAFTCARTSRGMSGV